MNENFIHETIRYLECTQQPLSADIGIIRENGETWLFDVGCEGSALPVLKERCNVVLSHFHQDHTGNLEQVPIQQLFVSKETYKHVHRGIIVTESIQQGNLRVFPIPSSHCKGCLGLEINDTFAFVGDALYSKVKNGFFVYNAQFLKEEIAVLKALRAPYLLISHHQGLIQKKEDALAKLEAVYQKRAPNCSEIKIPIGTNDE